MNSKLLKFSLVCATGAMILAANSKTALAYEEGLAGFTHDKINVRNSEEDDSNIFTLSTEDILMPGFENIGIANVESNLMIRSGKGESYKILGKLPKNGGCTILEYDDGSGWTKVISNKVTGYVKSNYLITGPDAAILAREVGNYIAKSNTDSGLNIRKGPSVDSEVIDQVAKGEELIVLDALVEAYGEVVNKWVMVSLDGDGETGTIGYVAKEYVDLSYELKKAQSMEELDFGGGVSSLRSNLVNYAKRFLGNPYRWGKTSLTSGTDCSGYTMRIYEKFGYDIPRVSRDQARSGRTISTSQLKPGDLVFYGSGSYINHVAIYMGNNKVIHASNRRDGIKISNLYYRKPIKCVRFIKD